MDDFPEVPLRVRGFAFIELASSTQGVLGRTFEALGFVKVGMRRSGEAALYRHGGMTFLVNGNPDSMDVCFLTGHVLPVTALAIRVEDAQASFSRALELGAEPMDSEMGPLGLRVPPLQGVAAVPLYLVDDDTNLACFYDDPGFPADAGRHDAGGGSIAIDHVAYSVYGGRLSYWASLHERLFGAGALRCLDLDTAGAEGIRHIALRTGMPGAAFDALRAAGIPLLVAPPNGSQPGDTSCLRLRMAAGCLTVEFNGHAPGSSEQRAFACAFA